MKDGNVKIAVPSQKPRITQVKIYAAIASLFAFFAGILFNIHVTPISLEIAICFFFVLFSSLGFRLWLKNNHRTKIAYNGWFIAIMVLGLAGCIMLLRLELTEKAALKSEPTPPCIGLDIGPVLDPKDPFGQSFIICNQGVEPIYNVWSQLYWNDPNSPSKRTISIIGAMNPTPRLPRGTKQGLQFGRPDSSSPTNNFYPFGPKTFVNVDVRYTPDSLQHETNQVFQFCVVQNSGGNYIWIPDGEGESLTNMAKKLQQTKARIIDEIPLIEVRIDGFEDISQTNRDYPIKISYSWHNSGGEAATDVYIEWAVLHNDGFPYMIWNHHGDVFKEILWPGWTGRGDRIYSESPNHDIFKGVMSGDFILAGFVCFSDAQKHEYLMQFSAFRTNNNFEIKYIGFGGYFQELERKNGNTNDADKLKIR